MKKLIAPSLVIMLTIVFCCSIAFAQTSLDFYTNYVRWGFELNADIVGEVEGRKMGAYSVTQVGGLSVYFSPSNFDLNAITIKMAGTSTDSPEINLDRMYAVIVAVENGECNAPSKQEKASAIDGAGVIIDKAIKAVASSEDFYNGTEIYFHESDNAFYYVFPRMTVEDSDTYMLILPKK